MRPRVFPAEDLGSRSRSNIRHSSFNEAAGIPRGRRNRVSGGTVPGNSFNEAAGIPRGRQPTRPCPRPPPGPASMRPRVFPAEDKQNLTEKGPSHYGCFNEAAGIPRGRRVHPLPVRQAEVGFNEAAGIPRGRLVRPQRTIRRFVRASMRPRVFPAEDHIARIVPGLLRDASMRPRVFPAEDLPARQCFPSPCHRFNEAAGIPRGRRTEPGAPERVVACFNEAAGIPRGRLQSSTTTRYRPIGFNEAAGIPRGRLPSGLTIRCRCSYGLQ